MWLVYCCEGLSVVECLVGNGMEWVVWMNCRVRLALRFFDLVGGLFWVLMTTQPPVDRGCSIHGTFRRICFGWSIFVFLGSFDGPIIFYVWYSTRRIESTFFRVFSCFFFAVRSFVLSLVAGLCTNRTRLLTVFFCWMTGGAGWRSRRQVKGVADLLHRLTLLSCRWDVWWWSGEE